jgi:nitroimidazol reductase NimA-like FMN-containing flavoprotein (pyridoxamine 5'-phosphate oxidase superfamily)
MGQDSRQHRARLRRHPERSVQPEAPAILAAGLVAHVGFVHDGEPCVIPMAYHYDPATPRTLYLHGAHPSRLLRHVASGAPIALAVTLVDGLVFSRTALYHSVNYRSVVCFAHAAPPLDRHEAAVALEAMIARYFPGRTAGQDYAAPPAQDIDATSVIALEIDDWSAKLRRGGPTGPLDGDPNAPGSAGVVELDRP